MSDTTRADLQAALDQAVASVQDPAQLLAWLREREGRREVFHRMDGYHSASHTEVFRFYNEGVRGELAYIGRWHGGDIAAFNFGGSPAQVVVAGSVPEWARQLLAWILASRSRGPATRAELIALVERIAAEHAEAPPCA